MICCCTFNAFSVFGRICTDIVFLNFTFCSRDQMHVQGVVGMYLCHPIVNALFSVSLMINETFIISAIDHYATNTVRTYWVKAIEYSNA